MPAARQNALLKQYCLVCHSGAVRNGGLSLEDFDAARPNAADAAMIVSKLKTGALGAAGLRPPDAATAASLVDALTLASAGSRQWIVTEYAGRPLTATIVQEYPAAAKGGQPNLYRLTLSCHANTRQGEVQLAWSPDVPPDGRAVTAMLDRQLPRSFTVSGFEKMGTGAGLSGPGAVTLFTTAADPKSPQLPLPEQSLTIAGLFGSETVSFPVGELPPAVRRGLSACLR